MWVTFLLTLCARLHPTTARAVAFAQAALLILSQRRACVGIVANRHGTAPYFIATARAGRAGVQWVVGVLLSDGLCPAPPALVVPAGPPAPTPPPLAAAQKACFPVMAALHFGALAAGLALRYRTLAERAGSPGRRPVRTLAGRAAAQALAAGLVGIGVADLISFLERGQVLHWG